MPEVVSSAANLLQDALTWILFLIPVAAALMIGYHSLLKIMSDGEAGEIAERNKKMKQILIAAVIAFAAVGIVTAILAYF